MNLMRSGGTEFAGDSIRNTIGYIAKIIRLDDASN